MEALVAIELADFCKCEKRPPETCSGSTGREPARRKEETQLLTRLLHRCVDKSQQPARRKEETQLLTSLAH